MNLFFFDFYAEQGQSDEAGEEAWVPFQNDYFERKADHVKKEKEGEEECFRASSIFQVGSMFEKKYRNLSEDEITSVFELGEKFQNSAVRALVLWRSDGRESRFAISFLKGCYTNAVGKNALRRKISHAMKQVLQRCDVPVDLVLVARPAVKGLSFTTLCTRIAEVLVRAGLPSVKP